LEVRSTELGQSLKMRVLRIALLIAGAAAATDAVNARAAMPVRHARE
jgi:hypothetical protein